MAHVGLTAIALETSVLLNFVNIGRLDLLRYLDMPVVLPDQVLHEIRRPAQIQAVQDAVAATVVDIQTIRDPVELDLYAGLRADGRLGEGECAVLAVALSRNWIAGLQDRRARLEGQLRRRDLSIYQTEDLVLALIRAGRLPLQEADGFLVEWVTRHRFKVKGVQLSQPDAHLTPRQKELGAGIGRSPDRNPESKPFFILSIDGGVDSVGSSRLTC